MVNLIVSILNTLVPEYAGHLSEQVIIIAIIAGMVFGVGLLITKIVRYLVK